MEVQIKDNFVHITANNGKYVTVNLNDGKITQPDTKTVRVRRAPDSIGEMIGKINSVKLSPRVTLHVGDTVRAQHKKGGRCFTTRVREIHQENGGTFVRVVDPRSGGTHLISTDLVTKPRKQPEIRVPV